MSKISSKRIKAVEQMALVNRMVQGGMNHAYQRVVSKIDVLIAEAPQESNEFRRGLEAAKEAAQNEIRSESL